MTANKAKSLLLRLAPPIVGLSGVQVNLPLVEEHYHIRFPEGYHWLMTTYADGRFNDFFGFPIPAIINEINPAFDRLVARGRRGLMSIDASDKYHHGFGTEIEPGGIIAIGYTDNGVSIFINTLGGTKSTIVVLGAGYDKNQMSVYSEEFVTFIYKWLSGEYSDELLCPRAFFPLDKVVFRQHRHV